MYISHVVTTMIIEQTTYFFKRKKVNSFGMMLALDFQVGFKEWHSKGKSYFQEFSCKAHMKDVVHAYIYFLENEEIWRSRNFITYQIVRSCYKYKSNLVVIFE